MVQEPFVELPIARSLDEKHLVNLIEMHSKLDHVVDFHVRFIVVFVRPVRIVPVDLIAAPLSPDERGKPVLLAEDSKGDHGHAGVVDGVEGELLKGVEAVGSVLLVLYLGTQYA